MVEIPLFSALVILSSLFVNIIGPRLGSSSITRYRDPITNYFLEICFCVNRLQQEVMMRSITTAIIIVIIILLATRKNAQEHEFQR